MEKITEDPATRVLIEELESTNKLIGEVSHNLRLARAKKRSIQQALVVLQETPSPTGRSRYKSPSLTDCVITILGQKGSLSLIDIMTEFSKMGREAEKPSVVAALSRLKKRSTVQKMDDGRWCLVEEKNGREGAQSIEPIVR